MEVSWVRLEALVQWLLVHEKGYPAKEAQMVANMLVVLVKDNDLGDPKEALLDFVHTTAEYGTMDATPEEIEELQKDVDFAIATGSVTIVYRKDVLH